MGRQSSVEKNATPDRRVGMRFQAFAIAIIDRYFSVHRSDDCCSGTVQKYSAVLDYTHTTEDSILSRQGSYLFKAFS